MSLFTEIGDIAEDQLAINLSALGSAVKELVTNPGKALVDGNGQLLLKDSATLAKIIAVVPSPIEPAAATAATALTIAAAAEPFVAEGIENLVALAKATGVGISPDVIARIEAMNAQLDPQGDVPRMVPQDPVLAPTEPAPPANEPDMPSGMRPEE